MKKLLIIFLCLFLFFLLVASLVWADYYADPAGSGTTCSSGVPCTVNYCINTKATAGDTCYLKDGTYTGTNGIINMTQSGTIGSPITIKAVNDGLAIIDGQSTYIPLKIYSHDYVDVEGLVLKDPINTEAWHRAIDLSESNHLNLKRITILAPSGNVTSASAQINQGTYILLEDIAIQSHPKKPLNIISSSYITVRRVFVQYYDVDVTDSYGILVYGSNHCTIENCIVTADASSTGPLSGIDVWSNTTSNPSASYNNVYGNMVYGTKVGFSDRSKNEVVNSNTFIDNVFIRTTAFSDAEVGFSQRGDNSLTVNHFLSAFAHVGYAESEFIYEPKDEGYQMNATLKNMIIMSDGGDQGITLDTSSYIGTIAHTYNDLYNLTLDYYNTTAGTGEIDTSPNYDTTTYGNGAYLIKPSNLITSGEGGTYMGAEVLYRYQDGVLTNVPLWPWPMEARIVADIGVSVSYEASGGIWKTLSGVYPSASTANAIFNFGMEF